MNPRGFDVNGSIRCLQASLALAISSCEGAMFAPAQHQLHAPSFTRVTESVLNSVSKKLPHFFSNTPLSTDLSSLFGGLVFGVLGDL